MFCIGIITRAGAQDLSTELTAAFTDRQRNHIEEEIYVHTDREVYLPGDLCWFRIYAVDAVWHHPLETSKIAYVDLTDGNGRTWVQEKVSLKPGEQGNSFVMPVGLPSGDYTFRAYTRWMKNGSPEWFFQKILRIINPAETDSLIASPADTLLTDIQFFPEGGNLVSGLRSRIGVRITDAYGKGRQAEGIVSGPGGDTINAFRTERLGMGQFDITPSDTVPERVSLRLADGRIVEARLPKALPSGFVMRLDTLADEKRIQITVNASGVGEPSLFLVVHNRGSLRYGRSEKLESGRAFFFVERDSLGAGISVFTLLTESGRPLCERLYFIYPPRVPSLTARMLDEYGTRKPVNLEIELDSADTTSAADLSVAVYRPDLPGEDEGVHAGDINSYLWLVGDLGHQVEAAALYFSDTVSARTRLMDNLMLTEGWRRFTWKDLLTPQKKPGAYGPEFNGHIVEARMLDARGRPRIDETAYLSVPGPYTRFRVTQTDSTGLARFEIPWFYNSEEIVLQTSVPDAHVHFEVTDPFAPGVATGKGSSPIRKTAGFSENLLDEHVRNQVQRIYTGPQLRRFDPPLVDTGFFYGSPDEKYVLDDFVRFTTMEEVLREFVVSTNVYRKKGKLQVELFDTENKIFFSAPPLLLIDGIPVFDQGRLFRYDPLKIRRLDLLTRPYFMGYHRFDGVMNLVTYRGNLDGFDMDSAANVLSYPGINAQREFYSPKYETEETAVSRMPDFRSLLFWSPQILTNADGRAQVNFFTSDLSGNYRVVIEGLTRDGRPVNKSFSFQVKK